MHTSVPTPNSAPIWAYVSDAMDEQHVTHAHDTARIAVIVLWFQLLRRQYRTTCAIGE